MKASLFVLISIILLTSKAEDANSGHDAEPHEWPWQVMIKKSGTFLCGGSLISADWVLTAAHCFVAISKNPAIYTIEVGELRLSARKPVQKTLGVAFLLIHEHYRFDTLINDVALLLLNETVNITSKIRPIKLPRQGNRIDAGKTCYITGWGSFNKYRSHPKILLEAPLKIGNDSICGKERGVKLTYDIATMVCAGSDKKVGCYGDPGGPLSCYEGGQWILRGVTSWRGALCPNLKYMVFVRVSSFKRWISRVQQLKGNLNCTFDETKNSLCQPLWHQDKYNDNHDWSRKRGPSGIHSPSANDTKDSNLGYYLYIAGFAVKTEANRLKSTFLNITDGCLSFWYQMHGRDTGSLSVLLENRQGHLKNIWSRKGPSGNRWLEGKVSLRNPGITSIIFEGIRGGGRECFIAMDDIVLTKGLCSISQSCRDQTCYNNGNAYCLNNTGYCYCHSGSSGKNCEFLSYNCSFDGGLCPWWDQDTTDDIDWYRYQAPSGGGNGPFRDHTKGSGSYYFLLPIYTRLGDRARLISKILPATKHSCFTFWYHMYGRNINTLNILMNKSGQHTVVWSRKIQSGLNRWLEGKVTLKSDGQFQIIIEGIASKSVFSREEIAIDDVSIANETCSISKSCRDQHCYNDGHVYCLNNTGHCYCPDDSIGQQCERYRCNFNQDACWSLWYQDWTDVFDWTRNVGPTPVSNTGPSTDHISKDTVKISNQTYIAVYASCKYTAINKYSGRFTSPNYPEHYGNRDSCNWLLTSNGRISISFESFNTEWRTDYVFVYDGGSSSSRLIGQYSGTKIPPKLTSSFNQLYVTFIPRYYFTRTGFSAKYGPALYIQGPGYYMYLKTDSNTRFGDTARFVSKPLPATNLTCLSFWYHMYGSDINALNVILKSSLRNITVWSRKGESGNRWLEGNVAISTNDTFQIAFEGVAGSGIKGQIAFDDISLDKGACNISGSCQDEFCYNDGNPYCLNNTGYCYCSRDTYGEKCQFVLENYTCTFDKGICRHLWNQNAKMNQLDWKRQRGPSWPHTTGPSRDHTSGRGYYMTIHSRNQRIGDTARLISRQLPASNHTCLEFWYHMYGVDIGALRILKKTGAQSVTVWSRNGQSGNRWLEGKVDLKSQHEFQLIIEAIVGGYDGNIAIDDVKIMNGTCVISESCRKQLCHNRGHAYCLNNIGYCYCPYDARGKHCETYICSFEKGVCWNKWYSDRTADFFWSRRSSKVGYCLLFNKDSIRKLGDTARFVSRPLPATNSTCLSFWYQMYGRDIGTLRVILKTNENDTTIWSRTGDYGDRWFECKTTIVSNKRYQIIFEVIVGRGSHGQIAIDNISMNNKKCNISESCRNQLLAKCFNGGNPYCFNNIGYCFCPDDSIGQQCERYRCNFNKDLCGSFWSQDKTDTFNWTRHKGPTRMVPATGPSKDHISKVTPKTYIKVQTNCGYTSFNKHSGRFTSPNFPGKYSSGLNCFWLLTSNEMITISFQTFKTESCCDKVFVYDGGSSSSKLLGKFSGNNIPPKLTSSNYQMYVRFTTSFYDPYLYQMYVRFTSDKSIAFHGFSANYVSATQDRKSFGSIEFFNKSTQAEVLWKIKVFSSKILDQLPYIYIDLFEGYYIYIKTKYKRLGDTARFVSKTLPATNSTCLSFWYHMYGYNINTLKVIVKTIRDFTIVWSKKGNKGDKWLEGKVTIVTNESYQIIFEGVAGRGMFGEIALDDISIIKGICTTSTPKRATTEPPTPEPAKTEPPTPAQRIHTQNPEPATNQTKNQGIRCAKLNCFNGGSRVCTSDSQAMCICPHGITGRQCQHKDTWCAEIECFNGGTRVCTSGGQAMCICPRGFKGRQCLSKETIPEKRTAQAIDAQEQQKYKTGKTLNYVSIVVIVALIGVIIALVLRNQHLKNRIINCYSKVKRYFNGTPSDIAVQSTSAYQAFHCENPMSDIPISTHSSEYQSANHLQRQNPSTHHQQQGVTFKELTPKDLQSGNSTHQSLGNDASDPTYQQVVFHGNPTQTESQI